MGVRNDDGYPGPGREEQDSSLVRREEELRVRTVRETTGRVRLRKKIVEEEQTFAVVVRRELAEVVEEGVGDLDPAGSAGADVGAPTTAASELGPEATGVAASAVSAGQDVDSAELVLYEQRPVVTLEWVPVERVRLDRTVVTQDETVTGQVRREIVEDVSDIGGPSGRPEHR